MKNKQLEKTFKEYELKELKRLRNRTKRGKEKKHMLYGALLSAGRK